MYPSAVHCHCRLEVEVLVELESDVSCEEETGSLAVVVLCSGQVLQRSGKIGSVERIPIMGRIFIAPYLCICRSIDYRENVHTWLPASLLVMDTRTLVITQ